MPHAPLGITKSREVPPVIPGPPNGPLAFRVSTSRHGVIGTKWAALAITGGAAGFTVIDTGMVCGLLVAPAAVMVIAPVRTPLVVSPIIRPVSTSRCDP